MRNPLGLVEPAASDTVEGWYLPEKPPVTRVERVFRLSSTEVSTSLGNGVAYNDARMVLRRLDDGAVVNEAGFDLTGTGIWLADWPWSCHDLQESCCPQIR